MVPPEWTARVSGVMHGDAKRASEQMGHGLAQLFTLFFKGKGIYQDGSNRNQVRH
jgi:hypothetical protein